MKTRIVRGAVAALVMIAVSATAALAHGDHDDDHDDHGDDHGAAPPAGPVTADEQAAYERARPVFERFCTSCHTPTGARHDDLAVAHLDLSTYPFGGHHGAEAAAAIREALGATGEQPTMPDDHPGAVKGDDLALVLAWADAFDRAHGGAAGAAAHAGGGHDMAGMDMGGMDMHGGSMGSMGSMGSTSELGPTREMGSMSIDPLGLSMARDGSGTAWQPDATPTAMHHRMPGGWMLMLHYALEAGVDGQGGPRGDTQAIGLGWVMGMASHALAGGDLAVRVMLSPEAPILGKRGYPLLLQTGEEVGGVPLLDRQHPHDLFMEVAARYAHAIADDVAVEVYAAPAGEPALGPVAFAHRPYALYDMTAPLGHHWQDSTHVSFGVVTAGVYTRDVKLEGSWFNGREPDENRYNFDLRTPDSWSGRLTVNPSDAWSVELSYGYLASPEQLEPDVSVQRAVASASWAGALAGRHVDAIAVVGHNQPSVGRSTTAALFEASAAASDRVVVFGRLEALQKLGADLDLAPADADRAFGLGALTLGGVYELAPLHDVVLGVGAHVTADLVGAELAAVYGSRTPLGALVFVEAHPARR